jgi:hypothetical protein
MGIGRRFVTTKVSAFIVVILLCACEAWAQQSIVGGTRARITDRTVVGGSTFGEVMRIVGSPTVASGTGTQNPSVIDADGDVLEDSNTTVSTAGAWTWGGAGQFSSTLGVTGAATLSSTLSVAGVTTLSSTTPIFRLHDSNAAANEKYTILEADSGLLSLKLYDDTPSSSNAVFQLDRDGLVPGDWRWGSLLGTIRPENNGGSNLGSMTKKYLTLHAWELWVDTIVARNTIATIGGRIIVAPTTELVADVASGDACIRVKHNAFRANDTVLLQKDGKFEKMLLGTNPIDCSVAGNCGATTNAYDHCSITRNRDGTGANDWFAGDAVVGEGNVGDGYIDIYSDRSATSEGYPGQVISDGPVAYWRMAESPSGQTVDAMGNVGNASEAGTPSSGLGALASSIGTGTDTVFDNRGATGYLTVANDSDLQITADLTIEWWMYRQSTTPATSDIISRGGVREYAIVVDVNGAMQFCHGNGSAAECETTSNGFVPAGGSDYDHYAIVRDATSSPKRVLFYKNGVLVTSSTYTQTVTTSTNQLRIGDNPDVGGRYFDGDIDEVAIYNYQLSADRILLHYNARRNNSISKFTIGPTLTGNVRTGTGAFDVSERWALGNLAGTYGYNSVTSVYGFASGNASATWISADATNGFRIMNGSTEKMKADTSGNLSLTGDLSVGTSGSLRSGATAYDTDTGYWLDYNGGTPRFRIGTTSAGASYLRWTGTALEIKSERFSVSSSGININTGGGLSCGSSLGGYYFNFGDSINGIYGCESAGVRQVSVVSQKAGQSYLTVLANNTALSSIAGLEIQADIGATPAFVKIHADDLFINGTLGFTGTLSAGGCTITVVDGIVTGGGVGC